MMDVNILSANNKKIFNIMHVAKGKNNIKLIIICYPFDYEKIMLYRAYKILSEKLSEGSYNVVRFDYSGTGDSSGGYLEYNIENAIDDIDVLIEYYKYRTQNEDVYIFGHRLGAFIANCYNNKNNKIKRCYLWDPIFKMDEYFNKLYNNHLIWKIKTKVHVGNSKGFNELFGHQIDAEKWINSNASQEIKDNVKIIHSSNCTLDRLDYNKINKVCVPYKQIQIIAEEINNG